MGRDVSLSSALVGQTVRAIDLDADEQHWLVFVTDAGEVALEAEGDCCSETWFADLTGVEALIGQTVLGVEEVPMPDPDDDRGRQEHDIAYGLRITTPRGRADIVYRNSSNGYYGGCYRVHESRPAGSTRWRRITGDYPS